jgi:hypothetical protein
MPVREWLSPIAILVTLAVGIIAFFVLLPPELITVINFVSYASSLSTIIMVLVYLFTTSRQLNIMRNQLDEMQFSRNVEVQPLPYPEEAKANLELPRYYTSPATRFEKMALLCRIHFNFKATNIGNGPAVAVDFIPKLVACASPWGFTRQKETITLVETVGRRVECISLREGDSKETSFMFLDREHRIVEAILERRDVALSCIVTYKNALGMAFKEEISFWIDVPWEKEMETTKLCLKTAKTAEIDFAEQIREFESLKKYGREKEASKILDQVNKKLKERFAGQQELGLDVQIAAGSFSVSPISQSEYEGILAQKEEIIKRITKEET